MGLFDAIFGQTDYRAKAVKLDTKPGQQAIDNQAKLLGQQNLAQQYSLGASARGANAAMALREAQRRGAMGTQALGAQAITAQQQLQQQALAQQAQSEMAAQQINAGIAQSNAQGLQKGIGAIAGGIATGGMSLAANAAAERAAQQGGGGQFQSPNFMSDVRAKEDVHPYRMLSDFMTKEQVHEQAGRAAFGLNSPDPRPTTTLEQGAAERNTIDNFDRPIAQYQEQAIRPGVDPSALSTPTVARFLRDKREANEARDIAIMAGAERHGPSAVASLGVAPQQARQASVYQTAADEQAASAQGSQAYGGPAWQQLQQYSASPEPDYSLGRMESDYQSKELMKLRPSSLPVFSLDPARLGRVANTDRAHSARELREHQARQDAFANLANAAEQRRQIEARMAPRKRAGRDERLAMSSDFRVKEPMSATESDRALSPVQDVAYRYRPEAAARMAAEASPNPTDQAFVYADKRAPRRGIIAQDLERSPAFRGAVVNTDVGKKVNMERAVSTNLAATAGSEKRIDALEAEVEKLRRMLGGKAA